MWPVRQHENICGRQETDESVQYGGLLMAKILVTHEYYGCDTGCCGHVITVDGGRYDFSFSHPWLKDEDDDDARKWAEDLVRQEFGEEHVADLDWENSVVIDD